MTTALERPAQPAGALHYKTPVTPEEAFQAIGRLRKEARDEIDRLIRFLDKTDDYVSRELEDAADDNPIDDDELEPSLCGVTAAGANMPGDHSGADLEDDGTPGGRSVDDEPSLGSLSSHGYGDQSVWGRPGEGGVDAEDEHDGAEPETGDDEPSLANTPQEDALVTMQSGSDLEDEHDGGEPDGEDDYADNEPSLGWPEQGIGYGDCNDHELTGPEL